MSKNIRQNSAEYPAFYRYLYLISGFLLVVIGVIGIFLPILPTTIFLILASACFVKSSPQANEWLRNHKILGAYIKNYQDKSGLTIKAKIFNIFFSMDNDSEFSILFHRRIFYQVTFISNSNWSYDSSTNGQNKKSLIFNNEQRRKIYE